MKWNETKSLRLLVGILLVVVVGTSALGQGGTGRDAPSPRSTKKPATKKPTTASSTNNPKPKRVASEPAADPAETAFWNLIKDSIKPQDFRTYLDAYPNGQFAEVARERLTTLESEAAKVEAAKKDEKRNEEERLRNEAAEAKRRELLQKEIDLRAAVKADPTNGARRSELASFLIEQNRGSEAEAEWRAFLKDKPEDPERHRSLAYFFEQQKKLPEAEGEYREVFRLRRTVDNLESLSRVLVEQKKAAEAEAEWRNFLREKADDPERHRRFASFLRSQKRLIDAEAEYREAVRLKPDESNHLTLASFLADISKLAEAETAYKDTIRINERTSSVASLAKVLAKQKKFAEADNLWKAHIAGRPTELEPLYTFGWYLTDQNRLVEAEAIYRELIRRDDSAFWRKYLGDVLVKQGKFAEAEAEYRTSHRRNISQANYPTEDAFPELVDVLVKQNKVAEAIKEWQAYIQRDPTSYEKNERFGHFLFIQRRWEDAEAAYREAVRLTPKDRSDYTSVHTIVDRLVKALEKQHKWSAAERVFRDQITSASKSDDKVMWNGQLADFYERQKQWPQAEAALKEAIRLDPSFGWTPLGRLSEKQNKFTEAEAYYRKDIGESPNDPSLHVTLAQFFEKQGKSKEAESAYHEMRRVATVGEYRGYLGDFLLAEHRWAEAEKEIREDMRLASSPSALLYLKLALALQQLNRISEAQAEFKKAEELIRKALEIDSDPTDKYIQLGQSLQGQGRMDEANAEFKKAEDLIRKKISDYSDLFDTHNSIYAWNHYQLGRSLEGQRRFAEAEAVYKEALRSDPFTISFFYGLRRVAPARNK